jgi:hypothetical protein
MKPQGNSKIYLIVYRIWELCILFNGHKCEVTGQSGRHIILHFPDIVTSLDASYQGTHDTSTTGIKRELAREGASW